MSTRTQEEPTFCSRYVTVEIMIAEESLLMLTVKEASPDSVMVKDRVALEVFS